MISTKGAIKSKRAKMAEKKVEKSQLPPPASQPAPNPEQSQPEQSAGYNRFNIGRLKKAQYVQPSIDVDVEEVLGVVEEAGIEPMQHRDTRALMSYKREGDASTKYVSDLYLQERVQKIEVALEEQNLNKEQPKQTIEQGAEKGDENPKDSAKAEKAEEEEDKESQKEEKKRMVRYFDEILATNDAEAQQRVTKCFRCGKPGHIAKNCLQAEQKSKCMYCLGDHHHHDCTDRACFRCNQLGHISQECKASGVECRKCNKKGHVQRNCGAIVYLDYNRLKSDREFRDRYEPQDRKKLRCLKGCDHPNGHFNCFEYTLGSAQFYGEPLHDEFAYESRRRPSTSHSGFDNWSRRNSGLVDDGSHSQRHQRNRFQQPRSQHQNYNQRYQQQYQQHYQQQYQQSQHQQHQSQQQRGGHQGQHRRGQTQWQEKRGRGQWQQQQRSGSKGRRRW